MKWIAKPFLWILTCAIPVVIAACYGVYEESARVFGRVVDQNTGDGIKDILVTCKFDNGDVGETYSSTTTLPDDGAFDLWFDINDPCDTLVFEDVDGEDNGGTFQDKEISFDNFEDGDVVELELDPEA